MAWIQNGHASLFLSLAPFCNERYAHKSLSLFLGTRTLLAHPVSRQRFIGQNTGARKQSCFKVLPTLSFSSMLKRITLALDLLKAILTVIRPGGKKALIAENLLLKQQLLIHNRARERAPNLIAADRTLLAFLAGFIPEKRLTRSAIILKPATILRFHKALVKRKYRLLFSNSGHSKKPGPKGPPHELTNAVVEIKRRNPMFGCKRIAQQINHAFNLEIDKDVVRRILINHYKPDPRDGGPSWLTFLSSTKDSLWSIDFFRCESILLKSFYVMLAMDIHTRQFTGFYVLPNSFDGPTTCRAINAICKPRVPTFLSTDNDPLFKYHRWKATLRLLETEEVKTVPFTPQSHPFVERLIGTVRRDAS